MTSGLSRRGLFRAFAGTPPRTHSETDPPTPCIAQVGQACVETKGVVCRRCGDECDSRAIAFRPLGAGRAATVIDAGRCNGCAACLPVCPSDAIRLVPADRIALLHGLTELGAQP